MSALKFVECAGEKPCALKTSGPTVKVGGMWSMCASLDTAPCTDNICKFLYRKRIHW